MHRNLDIKDRETYLNIRQLANISKFKILELTQDKEIDVSELSQLSKLAFNKCSNYCTSLEKANLIVKTKKGVNTFIKSNISLKNLKQIF